MLAKDNMGTDRRFTLTDTATIRIAQQNSALSLKGAVSGTGYLVKDGLGQLNLTYGGPNNFAGLIVKKGIVAQGAWNSTFGRSGSPMLLAGGEVHQIDVNSTSTVPNFSHAVTVQEGTTNRILGSSRGKLGGTVKGKGNLTVETRYVRCDVGFNFKDFEGTLTAKGSQFRLMSNVTDMQKCRLKVEAATNIAHYNAGAGTQVAATLKIGSLQGTATDGVLEGLSTYQIGYLNEDMTFSGLFKATRITKVGTGRLTLKTAGHTSPITVSEGTLELSNASSNAITSGLITVANGATITGTATLQSLTLQKGATTLCELKAASNTRLTVKGNLKHTGDTIVVRVPTTRRLKVGDEITVYTVAGTHTGDFVVKVDDQGAGYIFDTSTLLDDGKLRVADIQSAIALPLADDAVVDIYRPDGQLLISRQPYAEALRRLPHGTYLVVSGHQQRKLMK